MKKVIASISLSISLLVGFNTQAHNGTSPHPTQKPFRLDPTFKEGVNYVGGHVIFKVKEQYRGNCMVSYINEQKLTPVLNALGVTDLAKIYPNVAAPKEKYNKLGQAYADLSLTYEIIYTNKVPLEKAINALLATGLFDYADPRYIRKTSIFYPNDPYASSTSALQYDYLSRINAYDAWDTSLGGTQGDTNIVIGIVDSGTDLAHPDLAPNVKYNYNEPINLIDDDGDGYVDNRYGWDFAGANYMNIMPDNDPQINGPNNVHGSAVSGDAAAATNNGIGSAGTGFKCKFLPIKCAADNDTRSGGEGYIITGDQGIQYAADHGCKVINCSWGGAGYSSYEQSIITYASINKNAVVVVAAGNDGGNEISYPAGYNYALAIAATNSTSDVIASFSNYNYAVDLCAPGVNIYNTYYSQTYNYLSGTSMATPITSGGVALVLAKNPSYTGLQAGQRIIVTTDNNYSVNSASYANLLGSGRLNLYSALTSTVAAQSESVVFTNDSITNHGDLIFVQGDTIFISGSFINYLNPTTSAATASITAISGASYVTAMNTSFALGVMATNTSKVNTPTPFTFKVGTCPLNSSVTFQVKITDGAYSQSYFITIPLNPNYVNITVNDVFATITSNGKIGWNQDNQVGGLGFAYNGDNLLFEGGLMIGTSTATISDCIRGANSSGTSDADFSTVVVAHKVIPSVVSICDANVEFNDSPSPTPMNLTIRQNAYAWATPGSLKFVIVEYILHNTGSSTLSDLFAGLFTDWDINANTWDMDKSAYDSFRGLGYSWRTDSSSLFAGVRLLTTTAPPNFYGIDNVGDGVGGVNITTNSGFSTAQKYTTLSTMRPYAGDSTASGNDICNVMSSGPFTIPAGDSVKVAFALLAGDSLSQLQESSDTAYLRYNGSLPVGTGISQLNQFQGFQVYPNPASNSLNFMLSSTQTENCNLSLINNLGQTVKNTSVTVLSSTSYKVSFDVSDLPPGAYMYKAASASGKSNTGKIMITR
jgi:serine protease